MLGTGGVDDIGEAFDSVDNLSLLGGEDFGGLSFKLSLGYS